MDEGLSIQELLAQVHDFESVYMELRVTEIGWFPKGVKPGIRKPPLSQDWVKRG